MDNPVYFHLHHQDADEDLPFWKKLAVEIGSPILELGCGTGRVLLPLLEEGHEVFGLDISFQALDYLIGNVSEQENNLRVFQADIGRFHIARKFSLVILACNTLSTFQQAMRRKVYSTVKAHLLNDGVFAASMPNPQYLAGLSEVGEPEVEGSFLHPITTNPVQVSSGWRRSDHSIVIEWHYDHLFPDGQVERETVEITHFLTQVEEYLTELRAANLVPVEILGDFEGSEYQEDSPYLILVAGKGPGF